MKITNWTEFRIIARAMHSWLGRHCPSCGNRHTQTDMDGGRCMQSHEDGTPCGRMLCAIPTLVEAVKELDSRLLPEPLKPKTHFKPLPVAR